MLQGYLYVWGLQDWLDHVPDSHRSNSAQCSHAPKNPYHNVWAYLCTTEWSSPWPVWVLHRGSWHMTTRQYHTQIQPPKLQFDKIKCWINCPLWICKRRISNPSAFRFLVGFEERLLERAMWKFASKNSWSQGLLKRAPTLPLHCGITHLMMAPPKSLKVLQGLPVMYKQNHGWEDTIDTCPVTTKFRALKHTSFLCWMLMSPYVPPCTILSPQCWTLEIFQFTCDSIIANLFSSPFHTTDCGNWSAYTSKQAGMHLAI
jgi:hypothetical protein